MYVYPVIFSPAEEGGYSVYAPDFKGCVTDAEDYSEGIIKIRDGLCGMIFIYESEGRPIPAPTDPSAVVREPGDIVTLVDAPMDEYRKRAENSRAVRKTISLPKWLVDMSNKAGLSLSQVTQKALMQELQIH